MGFNEPFLHSFTISLSFDGPRQQSLILILNNLRGVSSEEEEIDIPTTTNQWLLIDSATEV